MVARKAQQHSGKQSRKMSLIGDSARALRARPADKSP
jgi:hypothetical protein